MTSPTERTGTQARRKVFLVDDHPLVREWLMNVINQQADLIVCGHSEGREGAIEAIERKRPDVAIIDLSLKDCSGFDLIAEIKGEFPGVKIVVLSMHESPVYAQRALLVGASGYVVKSETTRRICRAIRDVLDGTPYISEGLIASGEPAEPPAAERDLSFLSEREQEVFRLLGMGNSTRQVSDALGISIKTVQAHCFNIREKLGIHGGTELLSAAVRWNEHHVAEGE
jgi:DNA-binding NarL/FixJ family response regulator